MYSVPIYSEISPILPSMYKAPALWGVEVVISPKLYSWTSYGYFAGKYPGGITTVEGVPESAQVMVLASAPGTARDMTLISMVESDAQGVWLADGIEPGLKYNVVGRKEGYNDVIMARVTPVNEPRFLPAEYNLYIGIPVEIDPRIVAGNGDISVALISGQLPQGVTFEGGVITSQWPTGQPGNYPLAFMLTDDSVSVESELMLRLILLPLELTTENRLPGGLIANEPVLGIKFQGAGGEGPYTYSMTELSGSTGLSLDPDSGQLSGVLDFDGEILSLEVEVTDSRSATTSNIYSFVTNWREIVEFPGPGLPYGWKIYDYGNGSWSVSDGALRIFGSGDFWHSADGGILAAYPIGDLRTIECTIAPGVSQWTRMLMLRGDTSNNSSYLSVKVTNTGRIAPNYRQSKGATAQWSDIGSSYKAHLPLHLRFEISGDDATMFTSQDDGATWTEGWTLPHYGATLFCLTGSVHTPGGIYYSSVKMK